MVCIDGYDGVSSHPLVQNDWTFSRPRKNLAQPNFWPAMFLRIHHELNWWFRLGECLLKWPWQLIWVHFHELLGLLNLCANSFWGICRRNPHLQNLSRQGVALQSIVTFGFPTSEKNGGGDKGCLKESDGKGHFIFKHTLVDYLD